LNVNDLAIAKEQARYAEELRFGTQELGLSDASHQMAMQTIMKELRSLHISGKRFWAKLKGDLQADTRDLAKEIKAAPAEGIALYAAPSLAIVDCMKALIDEGFEILGDYVTAYVANVWRPFECEFERQTTHDARREGSGHSLGEGRAAAGANIGSVDRTRRVKRVPDGVRGPHRRLRTSIARYAR
jgi:hypothetical protein